MPMQFRLYLAVLIGGWIAPAMGKAATEHTITFMGESLHHVMTQLGEHQASSNLYARKHESPDTWTIQVGVCHWPELQEFAPIVGPTVKDLRQRFIRDAQVYAPDGARHDRELMVETYLRSTTAGFWEFRLLRFVKEEGTPGIKLYVFSERVAGTPEQGIVVDPEARMTYMLELTKLQVDATRDMPREVAGQNEQSGAALAK